MLLLKSQLAMLNVTGTNFEGILKLKEGGPLMPVTSRFEWHVFVLLSEEFMAARQFCVTYSGS